MIYLYKDSSHKKALLYPILLDIAIDRSNIFADGIAMGWLLPQIRNSTASIIQYISLVTPLSASINHLN
jgi:hypothetical protein